MHQRPNQPDRIIVPLKNHPHLSFVILYIIATAVLGVASFLMYKGVL